MEAASIHQAPVPDEGQLALTETELERILEEVGLWGFPRAVGTPGQKPVWSHKELWGWWRAHAGTTVPMFAGHNSFEPVLRSSQILDRSRILFSSAFGDFDAGDGLNLSADEVHSDVQKTAKFLLDRNLDHAWVASGSMAHTDEGPTPVGFHAVVFFRKETHERRYLERWENGFWRGLKNELSVRAINIKCANPVALRRIPFTRYVHRKDPTHEGYKMEPNYCVPVPYDWVVRGDWKAIADLSFNPRVLPGVRYRSGLPLPSLEAWVLSNGWGTWAHQRQEFHPTIDAPPVGSAADIIRLYIPHRLCLQTLPFGPNPRHVVRVAFAHELLATGYVSGSPLGLEEFVQLLLSVGREAKWEDFSENETRRQATYIYNRPYTLRRAADGSPLPPEPFPYSCQKLREDSVCVGPTCPLFKVMFKHEWQEYKEHHPDFG